MGKNCNLLNEWELPSKIPGFYPKTQRKLINSASPSSCIAEKSRKKKSVLTKIILTYLLLAQSLL